MRILIPAVLGSALLGVAACFLVIASESPDGVAPNRGPDSALEGWAGDPASSRGSVRGDSETAASGERAGGELAAGESADANARSARRAAARGLGTFRGNGEGLGTGGEGSKPNGSADGTKSGVLAGTALTAALLEALEAEDLGALQGLLISELTLDGTRLSAEDLPLLFDALSGVDDYGMEKLILTHLERLDAPPDALVDGYLDYLEGARKSAHTDDIFKKIVDLGGDAGLRGLSELVGSTGSEKLRGRAALALAEIGDARGVEAIQRALFAADDANSARPFIQALARFDDPAAVSTLVDYVSRSGESAFRYLREIRGEEAAPVLARELDPRGDGSFQRELLRKLRDLRDPRTLGDLERFLRRAEGTMLRDTVMTVARIPDPRAADLLERFAARSHDEALASYARRSAQKLEERLARSARESDRREAESRERRARAEEKKRAKSEKRGRRV